MIFADQQFDLKTNKTMYRYYAFGVPKEALATQERIVHIPVEFIKQYEFRSNRLSPKKAERAIRQSIKKDGLVEINSDISRLRL